jgi:hypothetical protein
MKIFPEIDIKTHTSPIESRIQIKTKVRMLHSDGIYYLQDVFRESTYGTEEQKIDIIKSILFEIYYIIKFGKVQPDLMVPLYGNEKIFKIDPDQIPEEQRIIDLL